MSDQPDRDASAGQGSSPVVDNETEGGESKKRWPWGKILWAVGVLVLVGIIGGLCYNACRRDTDVATPTQAVIDQIMADNEAMVKELKEAKVEVEKIKAEKAKAEKAVAEAEARVKDAETKANAQAEELARVRAEVEKTTTEAKAGADKVQVDLAEARRVLAEKEATEKVLAERAEDKLLAEEEMPPTPPPPAVVTQPPPEPKAEVLPSAQKVKVVQCPAPERIYSNSPVSKP